MTCELSAYRTTVRQRRQNTEKIPRRHTDFQETIHEGEVLNTHGV